jgi:hypothetical protein
VKDRNVYKTRETVASFAPSLRYEAGHRRWEATVGPEVQYSETPHDSTTIVGSQAPIGSGHFGRVNVRASVSFDSREEAFAVVNPDVTNTAAQFGGEQRVTGVRVQASGFVVPKLWDVRSEYAGFDGSATAYAGGRRGQLALRIGGRRLWGDYAWFDAAYIGGLNNRGYNKNRFAGDASLYGNLSLQAWVATINNRAIPIRLGLVGFGDTGRVWLAGETSKTWHSSVGGSVLLQPVSVPLVLNALVAYSTEATRFYFGFGYPF